MTRFRVLNTRPREQAAELSRLLRLADFDVVEAPAIAIESAWDPSELAAVRAALASRLFSWVVLPSANAGRALVEELRGARVMCGSATARALGLGDALTLERFSAASALELLGSRLTPGERVLAPRAADARDELSDGLRALGATLDAPIAYRTVRIPDAADRLRAGGIDIAALCSPSAVASVADALAPEVLVVCLGQTTAEAAREAGIRIDAVATTTSMAALVDAIERVAGVRV
jgi:uroporphyrinogen-III synthase